MKIKDLQPKQGNADIEVEIVEKAAVREFSKFGKPGRVCSATIKDDTGRMTLTLWNEQIDEVKEGTAVQLSDAETKFHSLDILKANIYLSETDIVSQIEKNELALAHTTDTINQLTKNRLKLHEILEGMETAARCI